MPVKINGKFLYVFAFFLFIISACYGLLMRWNSVFPIPSFSYENILQGHSHVAFLGWGYIATIMVIIKLFVPQLKSQNKMYGWSLFVILITVSLMLISFPIEGYKAYSITLLSVFGIATYVLSYRILKDMEGNSTTTKLIKWGIYYYLLSSLATWFVAGVVVSQGKTNLYYNSIYFYLHFLYNGFFVFALFGIFFKILERNAIEYSQNIQKKFFRYLNVACIPAFVLSVLWTGPSINYNIIGFIAAFLQLISLIYLIVLLRNKNGTLNKAFLPGVLMNFALIAYAIKVVLQLLSALPYFVEMTLALKPFLIIGYLHLFTLAYLSVILLFIYYKLQLFAFVNKLSKSGVILFLLGVLGTELVLFLQGFLIIVKIQPLAHYNQMLLVFSVAIVLGLLQIFVQQIYSTIKGSG
jgi:hypothetical protein